MKKIQFINIKTQTNILGGMLVSLDSQGDKQTPIT